MKICLKFPSFGQIFLYYPEVFLALYSNALFRVIGDFEFKNLVILNTSRTEKIVVDVSDNGFLNISDDKAKGKEIQAPDFHYLLFEGFMLLPVFKVFISLALLRSTSNAESEIIDEWYNNHSIRVKVSIWRKTPTKNKVEIIQKNEPRHGSTSNKYSEGQDMDDIELDTIETVHSVSQDICVKIHKSDSTAEPNPANPKDVNWLSRLGSYYNKHFKPENDSKSVDPFEEELDIFNFAIYLLLEMKFFKVERFIIEGYT
ncbi:17007_t:CDS:2 [Cetraspora pellucida]|uniref:17007_t:CDS:1 n=1 Tax=Cetraspora pellucida TaxID=1433469 RepID=A0A9N9D6K0_9GLOM|nr:17007_t:CDS:2 [Cetraspora pellucida]